MWKNAVRISVNIEQLQWNLSKARRCLSLTECTPFFFFVLVNFDLHWNVHTHTKLSVICDTLTNFSHFDLIDDCVAPSASSVHLFWGSVAAESGAIFHRSASSQAICCMSVRHSCDSSGKEKKRNQCRWRGQTTLWNQIFSVLRGRGREVDQIIVPVLFFCCCFLAFLFCCVIFFST